MKELNHLQKYASLKTFVQNVTRILAITYLIFTSGRPAAAQDRPQSATAMADGSGFTYQSPWLKVTFSRSEPRMTYLSIDALGTGRHQKNLLKAPVGAGPRITADPQGDTMKLACTVSQVGNKIRYTKVNPGDGTQVSLAFTIEDKMIRLRIDQELLTAGADFVSSPWSMLFDATVTPASPLGRTYPKSPRSTLKKSGTATQNNGQRTGGNVLKGPLLLHFPDWGSLLIRTSNKSKVQSEWHYSLLRDLKTIAPGTVAKWRKMTPEERKKIEAVGNPYLLTGGSLHIGPEQNQLSLFTALEGQSNVRKRQTEMTMTVTSVYPKPDLVDSDPKLIGMKCAWLNIFGFRADLGVLANNSTGDACQFCLHCYADQALYTPPLFDDFTALDLVKSSLDHYFDGLIGYSDKFQDVAPSTIIAAWDYVVYKPDFDWLHGRITRLEEYADRIVRMDQDGDGLCESPVGATNWWDVFNFGGKDAYSSALSWRAFRCLADLERRLGNNPKANFYRERADKIQKIYYLTFYNQETGVLAGWRTKDGHLKDKYFLWANGIAIAYGLLNPTQANAILDRLQAKITEVGFTNFQFGLPGNLISAGNEINFAPGIFPIYENGAATGSMAYYYLQALYCMGRSKEAAAIFDRMLEGYRDGTFQNGIGNGGDWKLWNGVSNGYEGMLVDAYYPLTAWITGQLGGGVPIPDDQHTPPR